MKNITLLLLIIVLFSCKKSGDDDKPEEQNYFRIKTATIYGEFDSPIKQEYIYLDDRVLEILGRFQGEDSTEFFDWYKIRFTYEMPKVIAETFVNYTGNWRKIGQFEYQIDNAVSLQVTLLVVSLMGASTISSTG